MSNRKLLRSNLMDLLSRLVDSGCSKVLPADVGKRLRRFSALERPAQASLSAGDRAAAIGALSLRWRGFRATQAALQISPSKCQAEM